MLFSILQDNSGTIEDDELTGFLKDLLELVKKVNSSIMHRHDAKFMYIIS